ncbi:hypothetical protein SLEP1_g57479 [Rubroshorea leprosula]|uniref:Uncharacterized protein n=1 Tax=Rubroshorea leprosula TaxID=152421 RepID=A0AAV5MP75_9ROSI|nr:hypothetical protein SLEP1_g57479 [Rubroshorea leprosula]
MVNTRSVRTGSQAQPLGHDQAQYPNNLPPQIPNLFLPVEHAEGGDENQPHNATHNSTPTPNQGDVSQLNLLPCNSSSVHFSCFKIHQLETCDGTKGLDDHLHAFYSCMQAQNVSDALMCKIFRSTLRGSAPDIMYYHCFENLRLDPALLQRYNGPIYGFNNQPVQVEGVLTLNVAFGSGRTYVTPSIWFLVVKMASFFNVVVGRPTLIEIRVVVSQSHLYVKFPTPMGITTLCSNPVLIKKANDKWQMCVDYTNLNQACPKDCYPMLSIDKLVETASGKERLSLLDVYFGYHQVLMALEDEEKTSFYAGDEIYCYVMMPFSLKNAGATYQKMSLKVKDHLVDLDETFNNLRKNKMWLNPAKCIFGVEFGKFLGFMVSRRGIEKWFEWNSECQAAFDELKSYLSSPPLLTKAIDGEILYLYLDISDEAISSVLVKEEGKQQKPVYYISSILHGVELRYPVAEKIALAIVTSAKKLRPYFQSHQIIVLTDQPLRQILQKPECLGRLIKWAVKPREFEVDSLSKFASDNSQSSISVFIEVLDQPNFMKPKMMEINIDSNTLSWTNPIISFLQDGLVPKDDKQEEMRLRKKASWYTLVDGVLYKRSFSLSLLRCLNPYEVEYALHEVHEGVCGNHIGARTLTHKVLRQGYYWLNMYKDATHFVQRCSKC